jgi:queuine tRNA-ribosyltransferase
VDFRSSAFPEYRKITEDGVIFNSHLNGDAHSFTPESTVDVQRAWAATS